MKPVMTWYHIATLVDPMCSPEMMVQGKTESIGAVWPRTEDMRGAGETESEDWV